MTIDQSTVPVAEISDVVEGGEQYSAAVTGGWESLSGGVVYTKASSADGRLRHDRRGRHLRLRRFRSRRLLREGPQRRRRREGLDAFDGEQTYGFTGSYDLGGGAQVAGGIASTFGRGSAFGNRDLGNAETVADFGIKMAF